MNVICTAPLLPQAHDQEVIVPPVSRAFSRRVEGENVWIYFQVSGNVVRFLAIVTTPPRPVD
jgi:hypothetical protein